MGDKEKSANNPYIVVIVARHGERHDYLTRDSGGNWVADAKRPWDPPLSPHGNEQGVALGRHMVKELNRLGYPMVSEIFSSPLLRCRQTAASARLGILQELRSSSDDEEPSCAPSLVRVEIGLVETICENWYRSWAMKESDGTWGMQRPLESLMDPESLNRKAIEPIRGILTDWKNNWMDDSEGEKMRQSQVDADYESKSMIDDPYTFFPLNVESPEAQRNRVRDTVTLLAKERLQKYGTTGSAHQTIMLFSHGAPVTHMFVELTGKDRAEHGRSSYCCYSMYKIDRDALEAAQKTGNKAVWEAIQVNQAEYLHETIVREEHL